MNHSLYLSLLIFVTFACQSEQKKQVSSLSEAEQRLPQNALHGLQVGTGLQAQLFAAEPLVRNPSNMDVDHRGRVRVVENVNYRPQTNPDNPYQQGGDQVIILEDTDNDGQADVRKVFFHDLLVDGAMGIAVLGNKVFLSSSPHILILTDENHDDKADRVDTLFTGMGAKQSDHTVHAVVFGPDGRLYFNFGNSSPGMLYKDGSQVIDKIGYAVREGAHYKEGMVFRCAMDGSNLETLGHNFRNNYEVCVDSYGRMWQSDNDDDGYKAIRINYVMEYGNFGYKDELSGASWQSGRSGQHTEIPARHWHQNDPGVIPNVLITGSGSPCGITVYEGSLLPEVFHGQPLHADAGPGVVRAYPLQDKGAGFTARQEALLTRKFDGWFRPTDVSVAPDGSVFAADWYDPGVGGHWAGDPLRGRIYRIAPTVGSYIIPQTRFDTAEHAVQALKNANSATRYLAWTAIDGFGKEAQKELMKLWNSVETLYRARALWLLARIDENILPQAFQDSDPLIRATAVRVARSLPQPSLASLMPLLHDPSPKVRREIAIGLREFNTPEVPKLWAALAAQHDGKDRWYLEALGIGAIDKWDACFKAWTDTVGDKWDTPAGRDIIWRSRALQTFPYLVKLLQQPQVPASVQARYLRATDYVSAAQKDKQLAALLTMGRRDQAAFQQMLLTHLSADFARNSAKVQQALATLLPQLQGTKEYLDIVEKLQVKSQIPAVFQMVLDHPGHELGVFAALLVIKMDGWQRFEKALRGEQQHNVIEILSHINRRPAKAMLKEIVLAENENLSARKKALQALSIDWGWESRMIDLLQQGTMPQELVSAAAAKLLNAARPVDRQSGLKYLDALPETNTLSPIADLVGRRGDASRGKDTFTTDCSSCHQVGSVGIPFGPNLSDIANKLGKEGLFTSIIHPNAAISHGFEGYHFELQDGSHYLGYILSENADEVQLRVQSGINQTLSKATIAVREALPHSLMTAGLAAAIGDTNLVDLVAYLSTLRDHQTMVSNPYQGKIGYTREEAEND